MQEVDINKNPPTREFLEKHIDARRFLDFVSTRSPVFKERPLPKSKKEAIDLMMENPNLIRRPILIRSGKPIFGFDKAAYSARGPSEAPEGSPAERGRRGRASGGGAPRAVKKDDQ